MIPAIISALLPVLDRIIPDEKERAKAKAELLTQQNSHEVQLIEKQLSAIIAEAQSTDKWTSRARPTFLYVFYTILLSCIAGGIVGIWYPAEVREAAAITKELLAGLPEAMWWAATTGYLGYTGSRSYEKAKGVAR